MLGGEAPSEGDSGETSETHFSKSYLDYMLLLPSLETNSDGTPCELLCKIIDAKARQTIKLGAKIQVTGRRPRLPRDGDSHPRRLPQVTYYALVMEALLVSDVRLREARERQPIRMSDVGGVWLLNKKVSGGVSNPSPRHCGEAQPSDGLAPCRHPSPFRLGSSATCSAVSSHGSCQRS